MIKILPVSKDLTLNCCIFIDLYKKYDVPAPTTIPPAPKVKAEAEAEAEAEAAP